MSDDDKSLASKHHCSELFISAQHEPQTDLFKQPPALYPAVLDKTNPSFAQNPPELLTEAICQQATCGLDVCAEVEPVHQANCQSGHPGTELLVSNGQPELAGSLDQLLGHDGQGQSATSDTPVTTIAGAPLRRSSSIHKDFPAHWSNSSTASTRSLEKNRPHFYDHLITAFVMKNKLSIEEMLPLFQKTCVILNRIMPARHWIADWNKPKPVWSIRRNHAKTEELIDGECLANKSNNPTSSFMAKDSNHMSTSTASKSRLKRSYQHISSQNRSRRRDVIVDNAPKCGLLLVRSPLERIKKAKVCIYIDMLYQKETHHRRVHFGTTTGKHKQCYTNV